MRKLFKKIASLSFGLAMAIGVGVGLGQTKASEVMGSQDIKLTFDLSRNPGGWPTSNSTTLADYIYTLNDVDYTFKLSNVKCNSGYLMLTQPAVLGLPAIENAKLSKVVAKNTSGCSTGVYVGISKSSSSEEYVEGGAKQKWDKQSSSYTYSLTETLENTVYYLYVTSKNAQIVELTLTYETASTKTLTAISVKQAPNKISYLAGELFDPTGLVLDGVYDDETHEDIPYEGNEEDFDFNPSLVTELKTSDTSVAVSYEELTSSNDIQITVNSVVDVLNVVEAPSSVDVDSTIPLDSVVLEVSLNNGGTIHVHPTEISCDTSSQGSKTATATYSPATGIKTITFNVEVICLVHADYDLTKISGFEKWTNSYSAHTVTNDDVGVLVDSVIEFKIASKQSSGVGSTYPLIASKTTKELVAFNFTLNEEGYKIAGVSIQFVQRSTNSPDLFLHKGSGIESQPMVSMTVNAGGDSKIALMEIDMLNDNSFTIGYNGKNEGSNVSVGIKAINLTLVETSDFGELDHIKVTHNPLVMNYHVSEKVSYDGIAVTAYDNPDESIANFIDVTEDVDYSVEEGYELTDNDIGTLDVTISYEGKATVLSLTVYAKAEYELVTTAPSDWSGNYIIVASYTDEDSAKHTVAMNSTLTNFDCINNFKEIGEVDDTIVAGQESEFTIAKCQSGYSIQGKSNMYFAGPAGDSNGLVTSDSPLANLIELDSDGNVLIKTGSRHLRIEYSNGEARFRYYKTGDAVLLYKLKESSKAAEFADLFLGKPLCDGGTTAPSVTTWNELAESYALLSNADKELFRLGVASEQGTNIQQCLARYDFIIKKYGPSTYHDFMDRVAAGKVVPDDNIVDVKINDTSVVTIVLASVSIAMVATLCITIMIKRRRDIIK
ncbi:MAG: hypothetical protein MJ225_04525 [Bacilli bacterium]|nr:hypothetical protein [Bacilli bacterium]